ncbi:s-adenosylmethionine decarboxylase proenzyme [Grosmannia clavigera kw1407]|uniref:S-adenosylmethionine decarboxylase proenzyme n=1 Tax=Grosmannia clavigera (strain kw1407 / UAMH 11150) TaxID=655863 RepID=F0XNU9_GROCL|nr:s-adenosylmethionine decarboxylase proenzyme [Grosmannia clavigera kw1407]EFX00437.1 s-adenosylmethionine decarboxylase proenzyme [Grosmannia clavigera kw1407]
MVNLGIPNEYTFSPSLATPHLTINHNVVDDLDSSNAFEGPEKLLEVWFAPSPSALPHGVKEYGLKSILSDNWVGMLDLVNCKILSVIHSDTVDAYLLSESSIRKNFLFPDKQQGPHRSWKQEVKYLDDMFVGGSAYMVGKMNGDHWYLYITSPKTNKLSSQPPEGENIANGSSQSNKIPTGIFEYPDDGDTEVDDETLEILMTDLDPENAKQFYLSHAGAVARDSFSFKPCQTRLSSADGVRRLSDGSISASGMDDIFDVEDLHDTGGTLTPTSEQENVDIETTEGHALGTVVSDSCGLSGVYPSSVYPDARIDAYMFAPCGFSANGVIPAPVQSKQASDNGGNSPSRANHYFTVHVTPEPNCSFASFETNVPGGQNGRQTADIVKHVVDIFRPGRFSVTLFEAKHIAKDQYFLADDSSRQGRTTVGKPRLERIPGYRRIDRIVHDFEDYDLIFRFYEREDWVGDGEARVGEN